MKKCKNCNIEKDENEFYFHKSNKDRLDNKCKNCQKENKKKYCISFREKNPNYFKNWSENNKESQIEKGKIWYLNNREEHIKRTTLYQNKNKHKRRLQDNEYKKIKEIIILNLK